MKKILSVLLAIAAITTASAQLSTQINTAKTYLDANVNTNGAAGISGSKMNIALTDIINGLKYIDTSGKYQNAPIDSTVWATRYFLGTRQLNAIAGSNMSITGSYPNLTFNATGGSSTDTASLSARINAKADKAINLTINGTTHDLSVDRTWVVTATGSDPRVDSLESRRLATGGGWVPNSATDSFIVTKHGTSFGIRTGSGFWFKGNGVFGIYYFPIISPDTFTIPPRYGLVLNLNDVYGTWTVEDLTEVTNTYRKIIVFQNNVVGGCITPNVPSIAFRTKYFDAATLSKTITRKIVRSGGIVGVNCDYTSITDALNALESTRSEYNQYLLYLMNGTYAEKGQDTASKAGVYLRDYINIEGQSRSGVIIKNYYEGTSGPDEAGHSTFANDGANCTIRNCTIRSYKAKYAFHIDAASSKWNMNIENCDIENYGGAIGGYGYGIGTGLRPGQNLTVRNCTFLGLGIFSHGGLGGTVNVDNLTGFHLGIYNCTMKSFVYEDHAEYAPNLITIKDSKLDINLEADTSFYAGSGNPLINKGFLPAYTFIEEGGNRIGTLSVDNQAKVMLGGSLKTFVGFNEIASNNSGSSIPAGYAVKLMNDPTFSPAYPSNHVNGQEVAVYDGSGILYGFAMETIADGSRGPVQTSGRPQAYFNTSGGNITYGDALDLNGSGQVVKHGSGTIVAYAMATANSNGLTPVRLLNNY